MYIKYLIAFILLTSGYFVFHGAEKNSAIADAYPGDRGIDNDPDVLYSEHFSDGMPAILKRYTDAKNPEGMSLDSHDLPAGNRNGNAIVMTNIGGKNDGGHLFKQFNKTLGDIIYLRYYIKYPLSSKGYIHHESVWIGGYHPSTRHPNPRAGICGLGDQRISIAYEPIDEAYMDTYLYWGDSRHTKGNLCYGNDMVNRSPTAQKIAWDKWTCIELMIKLNSPVSGSSGELKVWQDGKIVGHWGPGFPNGYWDVDSWHNEPSSPAFQGFRWRTNPALGINHVWIEFYDDKSPEGARHHIKFANLVIAKKYIGPIKK